MVFNSPPGRGRVRLVSGQGWVNRHALELLYYFNMMYLLKVLIILIGLLTIVHFFTEKKQPAKKPRTHIWIAIILIAFVILAFKSCVVI